MSHRSTAVGIEQGSLKETYDVRVVKLPSIAEFLTGMTLSCVIWIALTHDLDPDGACWRSRSARKMKLG
ncbi:MAG TPA: hypothetical protein VL134_05460 [Leptolyngbya sp.]|nr:hypothetical protein [Leptolyngbya sp.]